MWDSKSGTTTGVQVHIKLYVPNNQQRPFQSVKSSGCAWGQFGAESFEGADKGKEGKKAKGKKAAKPEKKRKSQGSEAKGKVGYM